MPFATPVDIMAVMAIVEGAAPAAPSDPADETVDEILERFETLALVTIERGDVEYRLTHSGHDHFEIFVAWRPTKHVVDGRGLANRGLWTELNNGWTTPNAAPPQVDCVCNACMMKVSPQERQRRIDLGGATPADVRASQARAMLTAIFAGRHLYELRCGAEISSSSDYP